MTNHDTALVLALWAVAAVVLGLVLLDGERTTTSVEVLADPELTDAEVNTEFAALTAELEPDPAPYDHERDGL